MKPAADTASNWWVICLCAQWCGVCREWRAAFKQAAAAHPQLRFAWVDVEDEAEAMGDVDIETFPTVLIAGNNRPLFLGPVQPSGGQLARLIASLLHDAPAVSAVSAEAGPLLARLAASVLPKP
jgi:thioredoxin-like negative regulator of GroEL